MDKNKEMLLRDLAEEFPLPDAWLAEGEGLMNQVYATGGSSRTE